MPETCAQRTLVKSPPELWSEISDAQTLARRLSAFGEVRITRMEPETAVAWEGALVRGTVELAASGWGTKVTITAEPLAATVEAPPEPEPAPAPEPAPVEAASPSADPEATGTDIPPQDLRPAPREGFFARFAGWWNTGRWEAQRPEPAPEPEPVAIEPAERAPEPPIAIEAPEVEPTVRAEPATPEPATPEPDPAELEGLLVAVLDDLGSAHHRPFSRA
ncbi:MAG TPA: hypothetical protein PKD63_09780 [Solirubrobacteraceae bacterium]|nr:hypothetical protein [Solirubrobacteraceae bacterium]